MSATYLLQAVGKILSTFLASFRQSVYRKLSCVKNKRNQLNVKGIKADTVTKKPSNEGFPFLKLSDFKHWRSFVKVRRNFKSKLAYFHSAFMYVRFNMLFFVVLCHFHFKNFA